MSGPLMQFSVGEVTLTKIVEQAAVPRVAEEMITGFGPAEVHGYLKSSAPETVDLASESIYIGFHSWLLQAPGWTALIDPAVGNGKRRPTISYLDGWQTDYLDHLAQAGIAPSDVDVVISTHHHVDHVGWNTQREGDAWVPTFPNARYIWNRTEFDYFHERHLAGENVNHGSHVDSILPIVDAGLAEIVDVDSADRHDVLPGLTIGSAAGHTPGTIVAYLEDSQAGAVFVGDCLHHPGQVGCGHLGNHADADPSAASRARGRLLEECARTGMLLVPGHFTGPGCGYVRPTANGLIYESARPLAPSPSLTTTEENV